jgi:hypothetical protein
VGDAWGFIYTKEGGASGQPSRSDATLDGLTSLSGNTARPATVQQDKLTQHFAISCESDNFWRYKTALYFVRFV